MKIEYNIIIIGNAVFYNGTNNMLDIIVLLVFICCFAVKVDPARLGSGASQAVLAVIAPIWGLRKFALKP